MIDIRPHAEGCLLPVKAKPNAKKSAVIGEHGGALKIAVTAPPEDGRANAAILEMMREMLKLKGSALEILRGLTSRDKTILIRGLTPEELRERLETYLTST